jgi:hypothetical protein
MVHVVNDTRCLFTVSFVVGLLVDGQKVTQHEATDKCRKTQSYNRREEKKLKVIKVNKNLQQRKEQKTKKNRDEKTQKIQNKFQKKQESNF